MNDGGIERLDFPPETHHLVKFHRDQKHDLPSSVAFLEGFHPQLFQGKSGLMKYISIWPESSGNVFLPFQTEEV